MAKIESLAGLPRHRNGVRAGRGGMGRKVLGGVFFAGRFLRTEIALGRGAVCHALALCAGAALFCGVQLVWDRSIPFDYIDVSPSVASGYPGDEIELRFVTGPVKSLVGGSFDRIYFDGDARAIPMGGDATEYHKSAVVGEPGVFYKHFQIPKNAHPGPSICVTRPTFWHNPIQQYLWPIRAPEQKVKIITLSRPNADPRLLGLR